MKDELLPTRRIVEGLHPGELPDSNFHAAALADTSKVSVRWTHGLPYLTFINTDTVAHTLTLEARTGKVNPAIPYSLAGGATITIPASAFLSFVDGSGNGTVFYFYSDVAGPSRGGGASSLTFPTGARIVDDGAGGMLFQGSDFPGSNFAEWDLRHNGLLFASQGNNYQVSAQTGTISVYGTLVTSGRGVYAMVGPTSGFPSDFGAFEGDALSALNTPIATFHPDSTKVLTLTLRGELWIVTAAAQTWTVTIAYKNARGTPVTRTCRLTRDTGGDGTSANAAGSYTFQATIAALAATGGANGITANVNVTGAGTDYGVAATLSWGDAN